MGHSSGSQAQRIDAAIAATRGFPEGLGACGLDMAAVDAVVGQLGAHGMARVGEHGDVDLAPGRGS